MKRNTINFLVDVVTLLVFFGLVETGLLLYFVLPPGSGKQGLSLWGLSRHEWGDIHFWLSLAIIALIVLHVVLHWQWVCTVIQRKLGSPEQGPLDRRGRNIAGMATLLLLTMFMGGFIWLAKATRVEGEGGGHGRRHGRESGEVRRDGQDQGDIEVSSQGGGEGQRGQGRGHGRGHGQIARGQHVDGVDEKTATSAPVQEEGGHGGGASGAGDEER